MPCFFLGGTQNTRKGLLGICSVPLGSVLVVVVVVVITLLCLLKVHTMDLPLVNVADSWTKVSNEIG